MITLETFIPVIGMVTLVKKIIDFAKYVTNRDLNGAVTQLAAWIAGIVAVCLYAKTDWADTIPIAGHTLAEFNIWTQFAFGLGIASTGSIATDFLKSRDRNDSAAMPQLLPPRN